MDGEKLNICAMDTEELTYVLETAADQYSAEQVHEMRNELGRRRKETKDRFMKQLPDVILCPKCGGPNSKENDVCEFCKLPINREKVLVNLSEGIGFNPDSYSADESDFDGNADPDVITDIDELTYREEESNSDEKKSFLAANSNLILGAGLILFVTLICLIISIIK